MRNARWLRLLAYVTGSANQELLARTEYLAAENQILRAKVPSRLRLSNSERATLARDRKTAGTQSAPGRWLSGQAGYDFCVVSQADRPEIRRPRNQASTRE